MPRHPRLFIPGAIHHVYRRVARGEFGFGDGKACDAAELCVLAISRYGFRACDIAALLGKGRNSITRRLSKGLVKERDDPDFAARIDSLESSISQR